jgi:hypothetical protein
MPSLFIVVGFGIFLEKNQANNSVQEKNKVLLNRQTRESEWQTSACGKGPQSQVDSNLIKRKPYPGEK